MNKKILEELLKRCHEVASIALGPDGPDMGIVNSHTQFKYEVALMEIRKLTIK